MIQKNEVRLPRPEGEALKHARIQFEFLAQSCAAFDQGKEFEAARIATHLRVLLHTKGQSHALLGQCDVLDRLWLFDSAGQYAAHDQHAAFALTGVQTQLIPGERISKVSYIPNFGNAERQQPSVDYQIRQLLKGEKAPRGARFHLRLKEWWQDTVIRDSTGEEFSREDLVMYLSNTDGGAHVDRSLPERYFKLSRLNSAAVYAGMGAAQLAPVNGEAPTGDYTHQMALAVGSAPSEEYTRENNMQFMELGSPVPASVRQIAWELMRSVTQQFPDLMDAPD